MRSIIVVLACLLFAAPGFGKTLGVRHTALVVTAPGSIPVRLESAAVRVELAGGTARTTIDMVLANPGPRVLEGTLQFPLQPGQQVVAFALDVQGHLRSAVPVEKERGRQVLEAIERRGADPGLIEQSQGQFFRLRVYPFAPHGTRTVRITLAETLSAGATTLQLPLGFADGLAGVPVTVQGGGEPLAEGALRRLRFIRAGHGSYMLTLRPGDLPPTGVLRLKLAPSATPVVQTQEWGGTRYFSADVPVGLLPTPRAPARRMTLLWDSSASGARRAHDLEFALLDAYFHATRAIDVDLVHFRDTVEPAEHFTIRAGDWSGLRHALETTVYDGATTLRGWRPGADGRDVLLFSDGLFNNGAFALPAFADGQRLYAIRAGTAGDAARLQALAEARHGVSIAIDDAAGLSAARAQLLSDAPRLASIDAIGATDVLAASPVVRDGMLRIAGRLTDAAPRVVLAIARGGEHIALTVPLTGAAEGAAAAPLWAQYRLAALLEAPDANRAAISQLGRDFHIVTPGSSLIVLEQVADYARYKIQPPEELRAEYERLVAIADTQRTEARSKQLDGVRERWQARVAWWSTIFPKGAPPKPETPPDEDAQRVMYAPAPVPAAMAPPPPAPPQRAVEPSAESARTLDRMEVTGSRLRRSVDSEDDGVIAIKLQPWTPDSPFARQLRTAEGDAVYGLYLDERARGAEGTAFYLDVADVLFAKQRPDLALRVLSNLAELNLDNRHVLRVFAYRLMQAGRADLAVPVLEQVLGMGDDEPQSYRDLALAHAALGHRQQALDLLCEVVTGTWDGRFPGIEITALAELNALVATSPTPLDTHRIAPEFLRNLPLDLRAVLSWDADNSDMDLWVTDPNGEKVFYQHKLSYQGGQISPDFTGGYGPEEFALRIAKPGKYKVEANYFGDRQQVVTGPTTLQLWLSTRFGTLRQQDQRVTLRLRDRSETVLVGEFEVK